MKNPDDLSIEEKETLKNVFALNPALGCIYELRKELKGIFDLDITKEEAKQKVEEWEKKAIALDTKPLKGFIKTLYNWKDKVLIFFNKESQMPQLKGLTMLLEELLDVLLDFTVLKISKEGF